MQSSISQFLPHSPFTYVNVVNKKCDIPNWTWSQNIAVLKKSAIVTNCDRCHQYAPKNTLFILGWSHDFEHLQTNLRHAPWQHQLATKNTSVSLTLEVLEVSHIGVWICVMSNTNVLRPKYLWMKTHRNPQEQTQGGVTSYTWRLLLHLCCWFNDIGLGLFYRLCYPFFCTIHVLQFEHVFHAFWGWEELLTPVVATGDAV